MHLLSDWRRDYRTSPDAVKARSTMSWPRIGLVLSRSAATDRLIITMVSRRVRRHSVVAQSSGRPLVCDCSFRQSCGNNPWIFCSKLCIRSGKHRYNLCSDRPLLAVSSDLGKTFNLLAPDRIASFLTRPVAPYAFQRPRAILRPKGRGAMLALRRASNDQDNSAPDYRR